MEYRNYMEVVVENKLNEVLAQYPDCCTCETCRTDIAVIALNHLHPRYVSTEKGQIFARVQESGVQAEVEVLRQLADAIRIVSSNPHHGG